MKQISTDDIVNVLRQNDGEPYDNSYIARVGWLIALLVGLIAVSGLANVLNIGEGQASGLAALQVLAKYTFTAVWVFIVLVSLRWPSRKFELWLDENYPEHAVEYDSEYTVLGDLMATFWFGGIWMFRLLIGYAVVLILSAMLQVFKAVSSSGFPMSSEEVTQLTALNSFAIAMLTTLLAGVACWWLIDWFMKDAVAEYNTPVNSTLGEPQDTDKFAAPDGGEASGD